ncbi:AAA family ATPase [Bradyrhizobium retamae]|uniref:non-specific protein-tyrosine kinase n=1 Tax=Bradyrhizobium retamae TaxID=1300035 RepID=A0A0R3MMM5_9BRAD|nr:AAA family ATPase [Bradyrhizobium retamae]KRR18877.1 protein tyrosine kinase [Bradyrhizobium retamae]
MLQTNMLNAEQTRSPQTGPAYSDDAGSGGISELVNFALGLLRRQYLVIILTAVFALTSCIIYLRITPPTYTARVQVLLANPRAQFVQQQSILSEPAFDHNQIETQIQLLKSSALATSVITQLNLVNDPDFSGSGPSLSSLWRAASTWNSTLPQQSKASTPAGLSDAIITAFQDRLSANRIGMSSILEISFSSSNRERAAEIANAVAGAYIAEQLNAKFEANRSATSWLQDRLRDLGDQALNAERAVNQYKSQNNIVSPEGKSIDEQQVTELNNRLMAARAQLTEASARLNQYDAILRTNPANLSSMGTLDAVGSDVTSNPIINGLRQQYLELTRRESEYSARFGPNHQAVATLRNRLRDLRSSIFDEVRRLAENTRNDLEVAKQRQQQIEKQLAEAVVQSRTTNAAELTIRELENRAKGLRSLSDMFQQRYIGAKQQESFPISETRVVQPASPPQSKSKPKSKVILALGLIGGVGFGIMLGLFRELMDRVFRTSAQIEAELGLPCLALVPELVVPQSPLRRAKSRSNDGDPGQRTIAKDSAIHRAVVDRPLSRFAEAIRSIKLAIDLNATKTSNQVIGITSALPNEGKTTIAASLAQLIGHGGKSVIIVDCDLRNPSLSSSLAPNAAAGIIEVTNGSRSIEETVWRDPTTNLAFLPAVRRSDLLHSSELLSTDSMHKLFDRLRASYDYVIVDLPPLTPLVDVRATTQLVDHFILVVEWGQTKIDVVKHALHTAPTIHDSLIGTVLNKTDIKAMARYDSYLRDYYSEDHCARYGLSNSG